VGGGPDSCCWICGEWADPTLVRVTPSTTGGGPSVAGGDDAPDEGEAAPAAAAWAAAGVVARAKVRPLPPEMTRMMARPPAEASAITAPIAPVRRLRNILSMTAPDCRRGRESRRAINPWAGRTSLSATKYHRSCRAAAKRERGMNTAQT